MNIENLFIKGIDQSIIADCIDQMFLNPPNQPDWALPSSYEVLLSKAADRKIAISPKINDCVCLVESKEVVDFGIAKVLADRFSGTVIIAQLAETIGAAGYLVYSNSKVSEFYFDENAEDPREDILNLLKRHSIPFHLMMFSEVFKLKDEGWLVKQRLLKKQ